MRLLDYLNENTNIDIDKVKSTSMFKLYQQSSDNYIYRATNHNIKSIVRLQRRTDRTPKDMPLEYHKLFDKLFQKKFGWKARSAGVFATSDFRATRTYGTPYIFIPEDPYSFLYSTKIADLFSEVADGWGAFLTKLDYAILDGDEDQIKKLAARKKNVDVQTKEHVIDKVVNTYKDNNIKQAIKKETEIMFNCDNYYLINIDYFKSII